MALGHVFVVLLVCSMGCECYSKSDQYVKDPTFADQMCPADQVSFTSVTRSAVSCVKKCSETPGCTSLVYLHDNRTCFGIRSDNPFTASSPPLPGAVFYRPSGSSSATTTTVTTAGTSTSTSTATSQPPSTTYSQGTPMVVGLPDSQFTASSFWNPTWAPQHTRFNNTETTWAPLTFDANQWIQVNFSQQIVATHVLTKGPMTFDYWVTSYRVLTSVDCVNYAVVTDNLGNDKVFSGNFDRDTAVQHALEPQVVCRCLRLNPLTWLSYIEIRVEVLGHVL